MRVVEEELRTVTRNNTKTGVHENVSVGALHLADAQGVIACTLWRSVAERSWDDLQKKVDDSCPSGMVPFYRLTQLSVASSRATSLTPLPRRIPGLPTTENRVARLFGAGGLRLASATSALRDMSRRSRRGAFDPSTSSQWSCDVFLCTCTKRSFSALLSHGRQR